MKTRNTTKRFTLKNLIFVLFILIFALTACSTVDTEKAVIKTEKGLPVQVLRPGDTYNGTGFDYQVEYIPVDLSVQSFLWEDPDLGTNSELTIGVILSVSYRIGDPSETQAVRDQRLLEMFQSYNTETRDPAKLRNLIEARLADAGKSVTSSLSPSEMLGSGENSDISEERKLEIIGLLNVDGCDLITLVDGTKALSDTCPANDVAGRELFAFLLQTELQQRVRELNVYIENVSVKNIVPDPQYAEARKLAALELERQRLLREQLVTQRQQAINDQQVAEDAAALALDQIQYQIEQQEAQLAVSEAATKVELEKARRDAQSRALIAQVIQDHPEYARWLEAQEYAAALTAGNTVWILPNDGNGMNLFIQPPKDAVPTPTQ